MFVDEIQVSDEVANPYNADGKKNTFYDALNDLKSLPNLDIYATCSNSRMPSSDILTEFRGRSDEIRVHPLSFAEYYSAVGGDKSDAFDAYAFFGGMPLILSRPTDAAKMFYLSSLFSEVYLKDIVERKRIQREDVLSSVLDLLCSSIGSLTNPTRVVKSGTFNMIGGEICDNTAASGGGVYILSNGTFNMDGGEIHDNKSVINGGGVKVDYGGTLEMTDGSISENIADDNGGGVYVSGTFTMDGGKVFENRTTNGNGGGVYDGNSFSMSDGEIYMNVAGKDGGGVYVYNAFTMTGGDIYKNTASTGNGGGVYIYNSSRFTVENSTISGNSVSKDGHGGGVYVDYDAAFQISKKLLITGNRQMLSTSVCYPDNVYLPDNSMISVIGDLKAGSFVGTSLQEPLDTTAPIARCANGVTADSRCFFSDQGYTANVDNNYSSLVTLTGSIPVIENTVDFDTNGGSWTIVNKVDKRNHEKN